MVLTDQVYPDVRLERQILAKIGALLVVPPSREEMLVAAETADALLNTYFPLNASDISRLRACRVIARYGIGVDNIDLRAADERGIIVTNVPDYSVEEVALHTVSLLFAAIRRLPLAFERGVRGQWAIEGVRPIPRVSEMTIGIIGLGRIGRHVVDLLRPLGARILGFDPYSEAQIEGIQRVQGLDDVLAVSDAVTLHVPLTDATRGLLGASALAKLKRGAILVNTSRGGLLPTADLLSALRTGRLGVVALDVLENEAHDAPLFQGMPNVFITPHMAYYSESSIAESQRKAATQVVKVLTGQIPDYALT